MVNKENKLWIFPAIDFLTAFQKTSYVYKHLIALSSFLSSSIDQQSSHALILELESQISCLFGSKVLFIVMWWVVFMKQNGQFRIYEFHVLFITFFLRSIQFRLVLVQINKRGKIHVLFQNLTLCQPKFAYSALH